MKDLNVTEACGVVNSFDGRDQGNLSVGITVFTNVNKVSMCNR